ncbi:ankyrin repeat protein [Ancylostoma duodenale]|uniref:Ankyrin repeat protein n=1 Tax=Ancylostoma duodenale TaxID=51022 RepID=A0A0C2D0G2_9BILA|nr:ankyrin repeat protein [Ancylostoma duodenale]
MGSSQSREKEKALSMGRLREDMKLYKLVDMHGGGELLPWFRYATSSGDYSLIDGYMETKVRESMYNQGKGKLVTVTELERNERLSAFSRKKGKGKSGPNVLDEFKQEGENVGDLKKALKLLDGGGKGGRGESKYREIAWKLEERGAMGETIIGICLLQGTDVHNKLAMKIMDAFPKLINDINISEDFYGLTPLHQAVINQDCHMAYMLLKKGADVNVRCYGAFFCAEDQKAGRTDSLEHEYVELPLKTAYTGHMYFGEYPLSFAACMNHPDVYRLLIAFKANPNAQDTNGNTVLHMCVIHENMEMFRLAMESGARLNIANKQNLTPLTLAAKLAKKEMFMEILELEGDSVWAYGGASSTAYPLSKIDTINEVTGELNEASALSLVVYGETKEHLDLLDGLLETILEAKWQAFGKRSMLRSLAAFTFYYIFIVLSFTLRPVSMSTAQITWGWINFAGQPIDGPYFKGVVPIIPTADGPEAYKVSMTQCHLRNYWDPNLSIWSGWVRMGTESVVVLCVTVQLFLEFKDVKRIGRGKWWAIHVSFRSQFMFVFLSLYNTREKKKAACSLSPDLLVVDNVLAALVILFTSVHYLYYCSCERAEQSQLPSATDQDRFQNVIQNPAEAFIRTFILTIGEFTVLYRNLAMCPAKVMVWIGKAVFLIFELGVSILQFNLLIAMMTRTYETIFRTRKEYKRQWAQVILMLELSLAPKDRLMYLLQYSRPTGTNKKLRSLVVNKKEYQDKTPEQIAQVKEEKAKRVIEERKSLLKRRLKDMEIREGVRPHTSRSPRLQTGYLKIKEN